MVTGGASGIGLAIAKKFIAHNIFTIVIGRDVQKLEAAQTLLGNMGATLAYDLNNLSGIPNLLKDLTKKYGHIDILVNNAGINMKKPMIETSDEEFQRIILTNLTAVFTITRETSKVMIAQNSGTIINISSMAAQYGLPFVSAYAASKTAIEGITRTLAVELAPSGIRVNAIAPGFIASNMSSTALDSDPERKRKVLSRTPMAKLGAAENVADAAYFLATDQSSFVTGTVLPVDGGNSIGF